MTKAKKSGTPAVLARPDPPKTGMIRARIDPALKDQAEAILDQLGLNASDAIRLFYKQVTLFNGLPFPLKVPNADSIRAMKDADAGRGNRYVGTAETFEKLGI